MPKGKTNQKWEYVDVRDKNLVWVPVGEPIIKIQALNLPRLAELLKKACNG